MTENSYNPAYINRFRSHAERLFLKSNLINLTFAFLITLKNAEPPRNLTFTIGNYIKIRKNHQKLK